METRLRMSTETRRKMLQIAGNVAVVCLVVTPLTIVYWSGTWKLLDVYLNTSHQRSTNATISVAFGTVVCLLYLAISPAIDVFIPNDASLRHALTSRLLTYAHALGEVSYWHGLWAWLAYVVRPDAVCTALAVIVGSGVVLVVFSCWRSSQTAPFGPIYAHADFYTRRAFDTESLPAWRAAINDIIVFFVTSSLTASAWCGVWTLMDAWIFPRHLLRSFAESLACGFGFAIVLVMLRQYAWSCRRRGSERLVAMTTECACAVATAVNLLLWRGGWGIMKTAVLAGNQLWRCWTCHVVGMVCLLVLGSRGRGFDVDIRDEANDVGSDEVEGPCSLPHGADNVACHSRLHGDSRPGETRTPLLLNKGSTLSHNPRETESTKLSNQSNVAYT